MQSNNCFISRCELVAIEQAKSLCVDKRPPHSSGIGTGASRYNHGGESWDVQRNEIRQLYIEAGKTLDEVVSIMVSRGFAAMLVLHKTLTSRLLSSDSYSARNS